MQQTAEANTVNLQRELETLSLQPRYISQTNLGFVVIADFFQKEELKAKKVHLETENIKLKKELNSM